MSLPGFSTQSKLFSLAGLSHGLFAPSDRSRLFALTIYPVLAQTRPRLEGCYCADNGRVAIEPVLLLGVSLLQYREGVPDRQAIELLRYQAGWNFALNRQLGDEVFHPTTLVNFRQRLLEHDLSAIGLVRLDGITRNAAACKRRPPAKFLIASSGTRPPALPVPCAFSWFIGSKKSAEKPPASHRNQYH